VISTAPTDRQVKEVLWKEIRSHHYRATPAAGILNQQDLTLSPTQRAFGFTTNEAEKFQGWHEQNLLVIVDEASGVSEAIYEAIEGVLTGPNAKLLLIGNPNNAQGSFFEAFRSPLYAGATFHIQAGDVPDWLLPPAWAAEREREWGAESPIYQVRVLGEFPTEGDDVLIPLAWCTAAQERGVHAKPLSEFSSSSSSSSPETTKLVTDSVEIGADIARFGSDESVAYARRAELVFAAAYWRGQDTMTSAARIAALAREHGAHQIRVDDIGVGGGVVDRLQQLRREGEVKAVVSGVNVSEAPRDKETFHDRRTELYWGLRERFRGGTIAIPRDDTLLVDQLSQLRYSYSASGKLKLESKDDLRKRRGTAGRWASPDRAEACLLCFAVGGNRWQPVSLVGSRPEEGKG